MIAYAAHLKEKSNDCEFETNCDWRILEHLIIIQAAQNCSLIEKAIGKKWTLIQFLTKAAKIKKNTAL